MAAKEIRSIAVLGAGAGGCACVADLRLQKYDARLHARSERLVGPIRKRGGLEITGDIHQGFAESPSLPPSVEAVDNANLIMIVVSVLDLSYSSPRWTRSWLGSNTASRL